MDPVFHLVLFDSALFCPLLTSCPPWNSPRPTPILLGTLGPSGLSWLPHHQLAGPALCSRTQRDPQALVNPVPAGGCSPDGGGWWGSLWVPSASCSWTQPLSSPHSRLPVDRQNEVGVQGGGLHFLLPQVGPRPSLLLLLQALPWVPLLPTSHLAQGPTCPRPRRARNSSARPPFQTSLRPPLLLPHSHSQAPPSCPHFHCRTRHGEQHV